MIDARLLPPPPPHRRVSFTPVIARCPAWQIEVVVISH